MQIIKVPSVYSCKLPNGEWLNLALVRRLQFESDPAVAIVTWANGDSQVYNDDQALAIFQAWEEAPTKIDRSNQQHTEREVLEVLRRRGGEMPLADLVSVFPNCLPTLNRLGRGAITVRHGGASLVDKFVVVLSDDLCHHTSAWRGVLNAASLSSSITGEDVVVQGLLAFGAADSLITAVLESDDLKIEQALTTIEDQHERDRLTEIVQRLGVVQGRGR